MQVPEPSSAVFDVRLEKLGGQAVLSVSQISCDDQMLREARSIERSDMTLKAGVKCRVCRSAAADESGFKERIPDFGILPS